MTSSDNNFNDFGQNQKM